MIDLGLALTCAGFSVLFGLGLELYYNKIKTLVISHDKIQVDFKMLHDKVDNLEQKLKKDQDQDQDQQEL